MGATTTAVRLRRALPVGDLVAVRLVEVPSVDPPAILVQAFRERAFLYPVVGGALIADDEIDERSDYRLRTETTRRPAEERPREVVTR